MMRERPLLKIKPQKESGREGSLSGDGTGRSGRVRNVSSSTIEGDFSNTNLQPESPGARKDHLQITSKKSRADALTRSGSTRSETTRNRDLNNTKKPVHHYMKATKCFNAKSQNPVDLGSPKVKKKPDPDPYGARRKSENIQGLQPHKPRSRPSSVDFQSTPMLKRSPSVNSSRVARQNRQGIGKQTGTKKGVVDQIINDESSYLHSDKKEKILETDGSEIKTDMVSRTSIKDEMELLEETRDSNLSFNPEINCGYESPEKLEVISKNLPEIETKETIMEGSPKHADSNLEVITENKILERYEVMEEKISEIEKNAADSFPPGKITSTSDKDENCEKHEVIDTMYEEIDDLCVFSSSNDEADDLGEISIEDELSKIIGTESTHCTEQEQNEIADPREISIEAELSKIIRIETNSCTEQEQNVLSIDIVSIIEEITNELEGMEKHPAGNNGDAMHPTWRLQKWKVDYVLQRLFEKLDSTDKNKVSTLIKAFECVIPLMMHRMSSSQ